MSGRSVVGRMWWGLAVVLLWGALPAQAANPFPQGMVTVTLDDGWSSQYTWARPALKQRGLRATYYLVSEGVRDNWTDYLTVPQVQTLLAENNEISSHTLTHPDLPTLSATQVEAQLRDSQAWLKSQFGLASVPAFASPYGHYNDAILATVKKYYGSHRTVNGGHNFADSNIYQLRAYDVESGVSVETVRTWINEAAANKTWLILVFHEFLDGTPTRSTQYSASGFAAILDAIKAANVRTVTLSEGVALSEGRTGDPAGETIVYEDTLGDGFADWSWAAHSLSATNPLHGGVSSISFEADNWEALYFHHGTGLEASQYKSLELWVHGGTTGGQKVRVDFYDGNTPLGSTSVDGILGQPIQAGTWQRVSIPLSAIGLTSGTIRDLYIQDTSGTNQATLYIDNIRLTQTVAPRPLELAIFTDALGPGFADWSWATRNLGATSPVYRGMASIAFEPDRWEALYFHHGTGVDLSKYKTLSMWVHGGTTGGQSVRLTLSDGSNNLAPQVTLDALLGRPIQAGTWQQISVPLSSLGITAGTLRDLYLQSGSGGDQATLYIDDMQLLP